MRCFECGHLNPAGAQYCNLCGRRMTKQLIILDGQPPNEARSGAGDGFYPARFASHDTGKLENEYAHTNTKPANASEDSNLAAARSAFHPARFSTPDISLKSPPPSAVGVQDTEPSAICDTMLYGEPINAHSGLNSTVDETSASRHSSWFHVASLHNVNEPIITNFQPEEHKNSGAANEDEIAKRVWRIPRLFDIRGTNRFSNDPPLEEIMIEPPPKMDDLFRAKWNSVLFAPAIILSLITALLVMILFMHASSLPFYIALFAIMFAVGLAGGITEYLLQASQWRSKQALKKHQYIEYLEKLESAWNQRSERQLQRVTLQNPSIEGCIALMKSHSERIWEREEKDDDFLCIRVGRGERAFDLGILMPPIAFQEKEAELFVRMRDMVVTHRFISPAPVLLDLKMQTIIGILGNSNQTSPVIRSIIIQLATFHSPEEVGLVLLGAKKEDADWAKILQMPHVQPVRETDGAELDSVQSLTQQRCRMSSQSDHFAEHASKRFMVLFVLQGAELTEADVEMLSFLENHACKTCVIVQSVAQDRFPLQTQLILSVENGEGEIFRVTSDRAQQRISPDFSSYEQISRFLSALQVHQSKFN